jgi:hypothetical protein
VRSIAGASLFVFAGLLCPVLRFVGEEHEPDMLILPMGIGGAVFLIAHVFACIGLRPAAVPCMKEGKMAIRVIWGIAAAVFVLLVYWDMEEWTWAFISR